MTLALLRHVTFSRRWRYLGRDGSLAEWVRARRGALGNAARQLAQLPWFARNLVVKALIVARLRWRGRWGTVLALAVPSVRHERDHQQRRPRPTATQCPATWSTAYFVP